MKNENNCVILLVGSACLGICCLIWSLATDFIWAKLSMYLFLSCFFILLGMQFHRMFVEVINKSESFLLALFTTIVNLFMFVIISYFGINTIDIIRTLMA